MSDTKSITIQGVSFEVTAPYAAGHVVTEAEALALNQVRAENIRNNKARAVKAAKEEHGDELPSDILKALAAEVSEYDKNYEFTIASVGGGRTPVDPVEREAVKIAKTLINAKLKEMGKTVKDYCSTDEGKARYDENVARIAASEGVVKQAKQIVKAKSAVQETEEVAL